MSSTSKPPHEFRQLFTETAGGFLDMFGSCLCLVVDPESPLDPHTGAATDFGVCMGFRSRDLFAVAYLNPKRTRRWLDSDMATPETPDIVYRSNDYYMSMIQIPGTPLVACGTWEGSIDVIDVEATTSDEAKVSTWYGHKLTDGVRDEAPDGCLTRHVLDFAVLPDGSHVITAGADTTAQIWHVENEERVRVLKGHTAAVQGVEITPNAEKIITASHDMTARVWDFETGELLQVFVDHKDSVRAVVAGLDNVTAVTAGGWHLRVWDIQSGAEVACFEHPNLIKSCGSQIQSAVVVSGCIDGSVRVFDLGQKAVIDEISEVDSLMVEKIVLSPDFAYVFALFSGSTKSLGAARLDVGGKALGGNVKSAARS